jgi:hypothetical protein
LLIQARGFPKITSISMRARKMEKADEDRRRLQRFDLQAPTRIEVQQDGGRHGVLNFLTKDISSMGAYIETAQPLPEGAPVRLELTLSMELLYRIVGKGAGAKVKVRGKVIRAEEGGMAIKFDRRFKIVAAAAPTVHGGGDAVLRELERSKWG